MNATPSPAPPRFRTPAPAMQSRIALIAVLLVTTTALAKEPPLSHQRVMQFINAQGQVQPVKSREDWQRRRLQILAGMQEAMGPMADRSKRPPLDMKVLEEVEQESTKRQTVSFVAELDADGKPDRVTAYLWLPAGRAEGKRLPAILALHPTGPLGKGIVAGLGPRANRGYGIELAQRGYIVIAPDYPSFGDLAKYDFAGDRYVSGTMKAITNHMRAVDLLVSRDDVDAERIGVIGHSLGGHNAIFAAVFDERLKAVVSSCGWCPFHDYKEGNITGWTSDRYMPRLKDEYGLDPNRVPFDFYELVAALAPRPFFSNSPLKDSNFDYAGVKKAEPEARQVYELYGAKGELVIRYPDCDHDFPDPLRQESYIFLDRALGHTPPVAKAGRAR